MTEQWPHQSGISFPERHLPKDLRTLKRAKWSLEGTRFLSIAAWLLCVGGSAFVALPAAVGSGRPFTALAVVASVWTVASVGLSLVLSRNTAKTKPLDAALKPWLGLCDEPRWLQAIDTLKEIEPLSTHAPEYVPMTSQVVQGLWLGLRRIERIRGALDADAALSTEDVCGLRADLEGRIRAVEPVIDELLQALREIHLRSAAHDLDSIDGMEVRVRALTRTLIELRELGGGDDIVLGPPLELSATEELAEPFDTGDSKAAPVPQPAKD